MAGGIRVKTKDDFVDKTLQDSRLVFGKCRSLRRDHIGDSSLEERDQIELAFANDRAIGLDQASFRFVEAEENLAFRKSGVSGEFRYFAASASLSQHAPAEGDDFADIVADRKHDPVAKPVVNFA